VNTRCASATDNELRKLQLEMTNILQEGELEHAPLKQPWRCSQMSLNSDVSDRYDYSIPQAQRMVTTARGTVTTFAW
jgi:hypothetical protein